MNYLNYIKYGIILIVFCSGIWFVKDYLDKKEFKNDTENNQLWNDRFDSLRVSYIILTDKQMAAHIKEKQELKILLKENGIREARVTSIMNHLLRFRDTTIVNTNLDPILDAIYSKSDYIQPFVDSTKCYKIKGDINYIGGVLSLNINERAFNSNTTAIAYWERREWKFLGIKTRFLGKKQGTVKVVDKCGESQTINIDKKD